MWFLSVIRWFFFMYSRKIMWGLFGFSYSSNAFTYGRDISCHSAIQSFYVQLRHFVSPSNPKFLCTVETFCVTRPSKVFTYSWDILCNSQPSKDFTYSWDVLCDFSTIQSFSYSWDILCDFSTIRRFVVLLRNLCTVMTFFVVSQWSKDALVRSLTFYVVSEHLCAVSVFTLNSHRKLTEIAKPAVT